MTALRTDTERLDALASGAVGIECDRDGWFDVWGRAAGNYYGTDLRGGIDQVLDAIEQSTAGSGQPQAGEHTVGASESVTVPPFTEVSNA